jgi:4-diphosphocytidyl-2C-methyl-D-erythritol kinase
MKSITLTSPAKINLSLRILGKREDGFHEISTLMCKLALADAVTVKLILGKNSVLTCSAPEVPTDVRAIGENFITITPLQYNLTDVQGFQHLHRNSWLD